ncbi:zona pellucida sperm-binding protein 3-like [Cottoperca gobio]|uniref:Zona pellucida sperm-binding protein 3 n=1 Tax=Cottoperca gobio TaxID=56716 RepID=A0A6J2RHY4_COTGO|nr:zona pellucida sperm-binding protein 3-like [Cottoperca gobio]
MEANLQGTASPWIIVLISLSTLTESRLEYNRGSSAITNSEIMSRIHVNTQPQFNEVEQQQSAELSVRPRPVVVNCHPDSMRVVVQADMFDMGLQVDGKHLRLGSDSVSEGSACGAVPSAEGEFTIQAHLVDCGTKLSSTKEKITYSNILVYSPEPSADGLLRLDGATILVECHYEKRYSVDAISLQPTWVSSVSTVSANDQIDFSLLLMTDDWQFERRSYSYFLGDSILFQVSAIIGNHLPLRVYVDHCVATATPDAEATLRYDFIEHYGCLADAYLTHSNSHFLQRVEEHKLRFQLEAFSLYQAPSNQVYITCYVKAVPAMLTVTSQNRACSKIENRWSSVDGNDQACKSCDLSHRVEEPLPTEPPIIDTNAWPPNTLKVQNTPDHHPANYFHFQHEKPQQSSAGVMKRRAEYKAEQTIQLGPVTVQLSRKVDKRPSNSKTVPENGTT